MSEKINRVCIDNLTSFLADGETFTSLHGCTVQLYSTPALHAICSGDVGVIPAETYDLTDPSHLRKLADLIERIPKDMRQ
jgi:hypothetical protein